MLDAEGIMLTKQGKEHLRIAASAKEDTDDKWLQFRYSRADFPQRLLDVVAGLEPETPDEDAVPLEEEENEG